MNNKKRIKVVTAKIGLDDHFRGIISVSQALSDAGMEVVYLGIGQRIDNVVNAVVQEDADVIGLSFLCGGHVEIMRRLMEKMKEQHLDDVLVVLGGVIPEEDMPKLKELGVAEIFLPGTPLKDIVGYVAENVGKV
jgi:methylmalonyl-CoA mutase C-terminal domain/subunit